MNNAYMLLLKENARASLWLSCRGDSNRYCEWIFCSRSDISTSFQQQSLCKSRIFMAPLLFLAEEHLHWYFRSASTFFINAAPWGMSMFKTISDHIRCSNYYSGNLIAKPLHLDKTSNTIGFTAKFINILIHSWFKRWCSWWRNFETLDDLRQRN